MACLSRRSLPCLLLLAFVLWGSLRPAAALPAFARKYGLPCSACHEAWPMLNVFGQTFKDNGYQLMNDRDAPIWLNPSYWPVTFRITPNWHREQTNKVAIDTAAGGTEQRGRQSGFEWFRPYRPGLSHWRHAGQEHFVLRASVFRSDRGFPL